MQKLVFRGAQVAFTSAAALASFVLALAAIATDPAAAASVSLQTRQISLGSPFSASAPCATNNPGFSSGFAQETSVAVNPRNPRNILAAWIQDGRATDTVMASRDGGRTFSRILVPALSACTGGEFQVASDPGVEFAADGMAYFTAIVVDNPASVEKASTELVVSRSSDGGFSWERPRVVQPATGQFWDLPRLTPDPRRPKRAYYVYDLRQPPDFLHGYSVISITNDGGRTWSKPRKLYDPQTPNSWPGISKILINRDGSLLDVMDIVASDLANTASPTPPPADELAIRSTDGGRTWSKPILIGRSSGRLIFDPVTESPLATYNTFPSQAVAPNGDIYVTFLALGASTTSSRLAIARSTNGGKGWSTRKLPVRGQVGLPTIAVAGDGTVGIVYYAIDPVSRNGFWPTRVELATSRDRGRRWSRAPVARPFNLLSAATNARGCCFLGDYEGITSLPEGLVATTPVAKPLASNGVDVLFSRVRTSR